MKNLRFFSTQVKNLAAAISLAPVIAFGHRLDIPIEHPYVLFMRGTTGCVYAKFATGQLCQITDEQGEVICMNFIGDPRLGEFRRG